MVLWSNIDICLPSNLGLWPSFMEPAFEAFLKPGVGFGRDVVAVTGLEALVGTKDVIGSGSKAGVVSSGSAKEVIMMLINSICLLRVLLTPLILFIQPNEIALLLAIVPLVNRIII